MLTIIKKGVGTDVYEVESKREVHDPASVKYFKDRFDGASHILKGGEVQSEGGGSFSPLKSKGTLRARADWRKRVSRPAPSASLVVSSGPIGRVALKTPTSK